MLLLREAGEGDHAKHDGEALLRGLSHLDAALSKRCLL